MKVRFNKNRILLIAGVIIAIVIIAILAGKGKQIVGDDDTGTETRVEGDTKIITGDKLSETKKFNELEFSNVKFAIDNVTTSISAEVKNNTTRRIEEQHIDFNVLDKQGNKIVTIGGYVVALEPGESTVISTTRLSETNDAKAYNIEIVAQETPEQLSGAPVEGENAPEGGNNSQENS